VTKIKLVIDTTEYAGDFEREMCAYITGQYGECEIGYDIAEQESPNIRHLEWFEDHVVHKRDENGCARPVEICVTPDYFNDGTAFCSVAIHLDERPEGDVLEEMIGRAKAFRPGLVTGFRIIAKNSTSIVEDIR
jgi:hypothetical protein